MKIRLLIIFASIVSLTLGHVQNADALCMPNVDWPDAPCYGCPSCYQGLEKEKMDWAPYYEYKGQQIMESKLQELQNAIKNNMLREWLNESDIDEHENIHNYYYLNGFVPNYNGIYFDQAIEREKIRKTFEDNIEKTPLLLWDYNDIIVDGTVIEIDLAQTITGEDVPLYTIKVNEYFKGRQNSAIVSGTDTYGLEFELFENGLFYLKKIDHEYRYRISEGSIKTFGNCDARDLIEISPVLPNEKPPISMPATTEAYVDPCVPDYYDVDPDAKQLAHFTPLKQIQSGIDPNNVTCKPGLHLLQKPSEFKKSVCVTESTYKKLAERGWGIVPEWGK